MFCTTVTGTPTHVDVRTEPVLVEAHDEWQVGERRYLSEGSMALLA